jgi:hypothetical protein
MFYHSPNFQGSSAQSATVRGNPMRTAFDERSVRLRPFLLRFLCPLGRPECAFTYDRAAQLNVLAGQTVPAVRGGLDVKTVGDVAED